MKHVCHALAFPWVWTCENANGCTTGLLAVQRSTAERGSHESRLGRPITWNHVGISVNSSPFPHHPPGPLSGKNWTTKPNLETSFSCLIQVNIYWTPVLGRSLGWGGQTWIPRENSTADFNTIGWREDRAEWSGGWAPMEATLAQPAGSGGLPGVKS